MEHLNEKYNLDYYSSSESDSNFEPEHKYETLIQNHSLVSLPSIKKLFFNHVSL